MDDLFGTTMGDLFGTTIDDLFGTTKDNLFGTTMDDLYSEQQDHHIRNHRTAFGTEDFGNRFDDDGGVFYSDFKNFF